MQKVLAVMMAIAMLNLCSSCRPQNRNKVSPDIPPQKVVESNFDVPDWAKYLLSQEQIIASNNEGVAPAIEVDLGNGVKLRMVYIPAGEFMMGDIPNDNTRYYKHFKAGPQHKVTIKEDYYMAITETTYAQWEAMMGEMQNVFGDDKPVESISWDKVQEYIKKLNNKVAGGGFRLPSEAEWEYACRAGSKTRFCFGDDPKKIDIYAWCDLDVNPNLPTLTPTHSVATKKANKWGLYDMHGNVWEWCEDDWHKDYTGAPEDGSSWIDAPRGKERVIRGGSWGNHSSVCRSAYRGQSAPGSFNNFRGFRLVRTIQKDKQ